MLGSIVSLVGIGVQIYDFVSNIRRGDTAEKAVNQLEELNRHLGRISNSIEKLDDHIYYAPQAELVCDMSRDTQLVQRDLREVRQMLEPKQRILGGDILSSAMIPSPKKLRTAMQVNPWKILIDTCPIGLAEPNPDPDMIPVAFEYDSVEYVGWQMKGTLPILFGMDYNSEISQDTIRLPQKSVLKPVVKSNNRQKVTVAKTGGDYTSIQQAIDAAPAGTEISVYPGIYREGLTIMKEIHLVGIGELSQVILETADKNVIYFNAQQGSVKNLALKLASGGIRRQAVSIVKGRLHIEGCDITSSSGPIIGVRDGANPIIHNNIIHDGSRSGIYVYKNGRGLIEGNRIYGNALSGITIRTGGDPIVKNNVIRDGRQSGIYVYENGRGTIEGNQIYNNSNPGIHIRTNGNPMIKNNVIREGQSAGIYIHENGRGTVEGNQIYNNKFQDISIAVDSTPIVKDNLLCKP